jgi:hypothetical protein
MIEGTSNPWEYLGGEPGEESYGINLQEKFLTKGYLIWSGGNESLETDVC